MSLTGIGEVAEAAASIVKQFFPDKSEQDRQQFALALTAMQGQMETNKAEAANPSLFVSGWRPSVGWVCSASLALVYIPKAIVLTALWTYQAWVIVHGWNGTGAMPALPVYPDLGVADLIGLLGALLGMAGLRTVERVKDVAQVSLAPSK